MLKLHVFLVDTGAMFTFDMEMALESVGRLMEAVFLVTQIPISKQVLMVASGEPLNPTSRVASYKSAGTETNPIFLFNKSAIESPQPPISPSLVVSELSLEQQAEKCLKLPPTIETLVSRAALASEFHLSARELGQTCEKLILNQQLQQQGWQAVVSNLDNITGALSKHAKVFQEQYRKFLSTREQYLDMLDKFDDVISLLSRIPVLSCLTKRSAIGPGGELCLMDWINSKEQNTSLETLVGQCKEILYQFDTQALETLMSEANKVLECSENRGMKEIKGLDERLSSLQQRLVVAQQLVQEQADMAQGFKQNQKRAENIGDPSVLPDLCISHRKQLVVMAKNQRQLSDICSLCTRAKDELSANLHARLRWVMIVEHSICNYDSKLLVFHESLRKMNRRLEVLEQVFEAPRMYVLAVLEILRRKSFSAQFLEWGRNVALSSAGTRSEEIEKRNNFSKVFGNHFLHSLFSGLDDTPSQFAESPPSIFDEMLPEIDVNDIRLLQSTVPELLAELSLGDSLEESLCVRERLSQTNLTKLCDPNSNPKLVETLRLRELTGNQGISKMTVSQLHKEISQEDMPIDITQKQIDWQLEDIAMGIPGGDFEPSSLKTLPSDHEGLQSSQSSEVSDSLFRSAEGLDDRGPGYQEETVGVLELAEVADKESGLVLKTTGAKDKPDGIPKSSQSVFQSTLGQDEEKFSTNDSRQADDLVLGSDRTAVINDCVHILNSVKKLVTLLDATKEAAHRRRLEESAVHYLSTVAFQLVQGGGKRASSYATLRQERQRCEENVTDSMLAFEKGSAIGDRVHGKSGMLREENEYGEIKTYSEGTEREDEAIVERLKNDLQEARAQIETLMKQREFEAKQLNDMTKKFEANKGSLVQIVDTLRKENIECAKEVAKAHEEAQLYKSLSIDENKKAFDQALKAAREEHKRELKSAQDSAKKGHEEDLQIAMKKAKEEHEKDLKIAMENSRKEHERNLQLALETAKEEHEKNLKVALGKALEEHEKKGEKALRLAEESFKRPLEEMREKLKMLNSEVKLKEDQIKTLEAETLLQKSDEKRVYLICKDLKEENRKLKKEAVKSKEFYENEAQKLRIEREGEQQQWSKNLDDQKKYFEQQIRNEVQRCEAEYSGKVTDLTFKFEQERTALFENFEKEKSFFKKNSCSETLKLVEDFKRQRNALKEELEREKMELKTELDKEKSAIIQSCEAEKQKLAEEYEKQSLSKTSSIEEGIDALEWDKLLQKLKDLEAENQTLKDAREAKRESSSENEALRFQKMLNERNEEVGSLRDKLSKLQVFTSSTLESEVTERISFRQFKVNDLVMLSYDEKRSIYVVLTTDDTKYFLHPDSNNLFELSTDESSQPKDWFLAYITDEDYCVAKKVQNRFKLPVGTYFYRIHARPWPS